MRVKVFDFFSGCGGTSAGLRSAGMDIVLGIDNDKDAADTYKTNFTEAGFLLADLTKTRANKLNSYIKSCGDDLILFCGCAPCQPFSKQNGSQSKVDPRASLLKHFGRFVSYHRPDFILVENVPGIQQEISRNSPITEFLRCIQRKGYHPLTAVIDSCDYGVPQKRKRLVLMASLHGPLSLPKKTHGPGRQYPYSTVWDWIKGFPRIRAGQKSKKVPNHQAARLSELNLRRLKATPPGETRRSWPKSLILECHKSGHQGHTDVYGRLRKDQPASAMTTRCISLSNGRFGHPTQHRAISAREAATLQTFSRDFVFHGTLTSAARQIGNAVPVVLAKALGKIYIKQKHTLRPR